MQNLSEEEFQFTPIPKPEFCFSYILDSGLQHYPLSPKTPGIWVNRNLLKTEFCTSTYRVSR